MKKIERNNISYYEQRKNIGINEMSNQQIAVQMENITKTFGSVIANKNVDLEIRNGEILSLLGENGSGKTTLMNMLSGIYAPDEGRIFVNGEEVRIKSPRDAYISITN